MTASAKSDAPVYLVDFDGVICDSRFECMITSHVAYRSLFGGSELPFEAGAIATQAADEFIRKRYLARTAREFSLLWDLIDERGTVSPAHWEELRTARDEARLMRFHDAFYSARYRWMASDMSGWLGVHRFFPAMTAKLATWLADGRAHIVSSKDSRSIFALLKHHGIEIEEALVSGCEGGDKAEHFGRLKNAIARPLVFIDDNLENLITARECGIAGCLASWGYTSEEQMEEAKQMGFPVLTLDSIEGPV